MKLTLSIARFVLPSAYLLGGAGLWISFVNSPPDGLANVGLILYTLPAFIICKLFTSLDFPFFEGNYYDAHRAYFMLSVGLITLLLFASLTLLYAMVPHRRSE